VVCRPRFRCRLGVGVRPGKDRGKTGLCAGLRPEFGRRQSPPNILSGARIAFCKGFCEMGCAELELTSSRIDMSVFGNAVFLGESHESAGGPIFG
jgi:hypothetical protein